MRNDLNLPLRS